MKKRITILLLMLLSLFFSWSVNLAEKEYKIGIGVIYTPFEFINSKGKLEGIDVESNCQRI